MITYHNGFILDGQNLLVSRPQTDSPPADAELVADHDAVFAKLSSGR